MIAALCIFFFVKQKTAYELRISDWSSDVCSSDLGGLDMTLFEVDEAANRIRDEVDPDANIIFGSTFNASLEGKVRISVVATGIEAEAQTMPRPVSISLVANRGQMVSRDRKSTRLNSSH